MLLGNTNSLGLDVLPVAPGWKTHHVPEQAGWAGLAIWVDEENLCRHILPGSDRVEERVYVPLGPLADWFVNSWPAIAYEERPRHFPVGLDSRATFERWSDLDPPSGLSPEAWYEVRRLWWLRHFLEAGADGALIPDIAFNRDGSKLFIAWAQVCSRAEHSRNRGVREIWWKEAEDTVRSFVKLVAQFFHQSGLSKAYPWVTRPDPLDLSDAIQRDDALFLFTGRSEEELKLLLGVSTRDEIKSALRLLDTDPAASVVTQILRDLPPTLDESIVAKAREIDHAVDKEPPVVSSQELRELGSAVCAGSPPPEEQGHEAASALRERMKLDGTPVDDTRLHQIAEWCGIRFLAGESSVAATTGVHSLLGSRENGATIAHVLDTPRMRVNWARRFEIARLIGSTMLDPYRGGVLGRASSTWSSEWLRRRSGAFAAELLLPASGLRQRALASLDAAARPEVFTGIMNTYGVGARAAAHQLWNLGLLSTRELRDALIEEFAALPSEP